MASPPPPPAPASPEAGDAVISIPDRHATPSASADNNNDDRRQHNPNSHQTVSRTSAKFSCSRPVRFVKKLGHNVVNKVEDLGIGLLGATDALMEAGEGVGRTAASGVGAVGSVVEDGVTGVFSIQKDEIILLPRSVDTTTEIDISGTILRDLNRAIEEHRLKGTSNAESPLNTPWILLIFPILPIAFMYTKTALSIFLPPFLNFVYSVWTFFGWRFWFCFSLVFILVIIVTWESIKAVEPLRSVTIQVDVVAIKAKRRITEQASRQMPKIYKALDRIFPPITAILVTVDRLLTPKLGFSPLLAINAKVNGWTYDPKIKDVRVKEDPISEFDPVAREGFQRGKGNADKSTRNVSGAPVVVRKRDRGNAVVMSEEGIIEQDDAGVEFNADTIADRVPTASRHVGDIFEQFFNVEIALHDLSELHRKYTSVWVEWIFRDMVVDRSVIRDITTSDKWKGYGTCFDEYALTGEVRLPLRAKTTTVDGGFFDVPIRLALKGRDGLPLYGNDGARRYMRDSPPISLIGEIELSALRIGVGTDPLGLVRSDLRIPLHAVGCENYRAAVIRASARITPIDNSSYSYRQMLSPLPNGEWTVRVNVFELRNLKGVDTSGSSDPYIQASVMGMKKKTDRQRKTLSCIVNQLLFFSKLCTGLEFEDEKIVVEVMDWNRFSAPKMVGVYTIDAKRLLEMPGREIYRKWFALHDPSGGTRPAGFIKLSVSVVPPGDTPPYHQEEEDSEEFNYANLLKNNVVKAPSMSYKNWAVHVTVGWADMLPRMSSAKHRDAIRGYVTFKYTGWPDSSSKTYIAEAKAVVDNNIGTACTVEPQRRVIWNEEYILPLTVINERVAQEGITLSLYHKIMPSLLSPGRSDQLIGHVSVSFEELFKNMTTAIIRGDPADGEEEGDRMCEVAMMKPRYYNFYGKPECEADPYDKGVAFRGRVLVGVAAKPGEYAEPFLRPCPPPPRPRLEFYKLKFCILRATELPLNDGWQVMVECRIGLYTFGSTIPKVIAENSCAQWDERCVVSVPNMQFPEDVEQIPDFFVVLKGRKPATVSELEERKAVAPTDMREAPGSETGDGENPSNKLGKKRAGGNTDGAFPADQMKNEKPSGDDGSWQRKAFLRLPAKNLICGQDEPRWMFMDYPGNNVLDSTHNEVPGSILMATSLSRCDPTKENMEEVIHGPSSSCAMFNQQTPLAMEASRLSDEIGNADEVRPVKPIRVEDPGRAQPGASGLDAIEPTGKSYAYSFPLGAERVYTLRAMIWRGRSLPAADESGMSDPTVTVSMGDQRRAGIIICKQTVSPLWEELVEVPNIRIRDGERKPNVNVLIYDYDGDRDARDYLGRSIISSAQLDTVEPSLEHSSWYPVFSVNPGVIVGEILADFQLIPTEHALMNPMRPIAFPPRSRSALRISIVGLRDVKFLQYALGDLSIECSVSGESLHTEASKTGTILQQKAYEGNCNILDVLLLDIKIPDDLRLAPALNIYAHANFLHLQKKTLVATACIPLERWLSEHNRRLVTGETLIDDSFGMDAPVPNRLYDCSNGYKFRRNAKRAGEEPIGASSLRLHEIKPHQSGEQRSLLYVQKKEDVLKVGFPERLAEKLIVHKNKQDKKKQREEKKKQKSGGISEKVYNILAPLRNAKYAAADKLADLMPDVAMALGIEVNEDISLSSLRGSYNDDDKIDYDGTMFLKRDRGFCRYELESDFSEPSYGEFLLFRGDNRSLGNPVGRMDGHVGQGDVGNQAFPPLLPMDETRGRATLERREKRRAALEGARPSVGKVKARLDLIEVDATDNTEVKSALSASLRSFGRVFVPTEVVVRVYVLRAINLQQVGSQCNPYMTVRFYGGYPDFFSQKHEPVIDDDTPDFFCMFESRVKMPGGSIRIEVKDRVLPEMIFPVSYPTMISAEGMLGVAVKIQQHDIPVNVGKMGLGWSELIGETVIDLDARWYNSSWRALARTPVERRSLYSEQSTNLKGQVDMFVDIFDAKEVDRRPKMFQPVPISAPPQETYELRIVIYKIADCMLPYKLAENVATKLASFYVQTRLGNKEDDERKTERCKYVADGIAEFNWRMKWEIKLPSVDVKPRLKMQVFDGNGLGFGDDQLCATADIKLRTLFDEICVNRKPILKKKQWVLMEHPNFPDVHARVQMSLELTTSEMAKKKKCLAGRDGWKKEQHEDYVLPRPFQPAAFSVINPMPYFNYLILSSIRNLQWTLATILLIFPFIPMFMQFVFMLTPWQWYAAGGIVGLLVFIRISTVASSRNTQVYSEVENVKANSTLSEEVDNQVK